MTHPMMTVTDILAWAKEQPSTRRDAEIVPPPTNPMAVARELVKALYTDARGLVLQDHRGDFYRWNGTCWPEVGRRDVRGAAYQWLEHARYLHPEKGQTSFEPSRRKIDDVVDALRAVVLLDSSLEAPTWTGATTVPLAVEITAMSNGLLHKPTRTILPHTPAFFTHHSLPFPFEKAAPKPERWLRFLGEPWGDDESSRAIDLQLGVGRPRPARRPRLLRESRVR